jgi:antitoxin component YwqK of YwqJK toxin-antitoxin module
MWSDNHDIRSEWNVLDGKKHGIYCTWYENGNIKYTQETYVNGKLEKVYCHSEEEVVNCCVIA